jgi:hypothetical protein
MERDEIARDLWHIRLSLIRTRGLTSGSFQKGASMKTISWMVTLAVGLSAVATYGQAAQTSPPPLLPRSITNQGQNVTTKVPALVQSYSAKQAVEQAKPAALAPAPATNVILRTGVVYGGYASDLVKAKQKRALFNLKSPLDPQKDLENVWTYPETERVHRLDPYTSPVIILFSIKH